MSSFDELWGQARTKAVARQRSSMQLNGTHSGSGGGGESDYTVTSPDLKAVGNDAQELYHLLENSTFYAGAQTNTAANELNADGFKTGSALWDAWDAWRSQSEALLSACAHIHNHLEDTVITHQKHEEILKTNFSMQQLDKHFE